MRTPTLARLLALSAPIAIVAAVAPVVALTPPRMPSVTAELRAAIAAPTRTPANVARDPYRNPGPTLAFFGVRPTDTVVELIPGGGWYTEILTPYLAKRGTYYAASSERGLAGVRAMQAKDAATYGRIRLASFPASAAAGAPAPVPDASADVVLTFRNVHNLRFQGADKAAAAFAEMYRMLKPGGTLGIVEHRLPEERDAAAEEKSGYLKTSTVVAMATAAGFRRAGETEINANRRDTADHPQGVWTLPPNYRLGDVDRAKYAAIGESDRMTLRFVKPR